MGGCSTTPPGAGYRACCGPEISTRRSHTAKKSETILRTPRARLVGSTTSYLRFYIHASMEVRGNLAGADSVSPELPPTEASTTTFGSNCDEYPKEESDDSQCIHQLPFAVPIIAEYRVPQYRVFYSNVQQHATALDTFAVHTFNPRSSQQPLYSYLDITEEYRVLQ